MYDTYVQPYHDVIIKFIRTHLPIDSNDIVLDIGGGTGEIAHEVWKLGNLKNPVLCTDPSKNMVAVANTKEGVSGVQADAEKFFASLSMSLDSNKSFNKILMCGCVHLFSDPKAVFAGVKEHLSENGVCLVVQSLRISHLFKSLREKLEDACFSWEPFYRIFKTFGLKFNVTRSTEKFSLPKAQWYAGLRDRFLTKLECFTDEEIEEGIRELENEYSGQDVLEIETGCTFALVTKM